MVLSLHKHLYILFITNPNSFIVNLKEKWSIEPNKKYLTSAEWLYVSAKLSGAREIYLPETAKCALQAGPAT